MNRALLGALLVPLAATPAEAATTDVSVANFAFAPATVQIAPGDTVRWTFAGPDTNHTTTSDGGQAESWESDPGEPTPVHTVGDQFAHTFQTPGDYGYFCRVHPYMRGTVRVGISSPPPATADTAAPAVSTPRVSVKRRRATFRLDEPADVVARLRGRTRKTLTRAGKAGSNVLRLPRMRPGRYALTLRATDSAGNKSTPVQVKFSVRRAKRR